MGGVVIKYALPFLTAQKGSIMQLLTYCQKHTFYEEFEASVDSILYYLSNLENSFFCESILKILESLQSAAKTFKETELFVYLDKIISNIYRGRIRSPRVINELYNLCDIKIYPIDSTLRLELKQ